MMDRTSCIKQVVEQYHVTARVSYAAKGIHFMADELDDVRYGYIVDDYFIDYNTGNICESSYFHVVINLEEYNY
jgi:hypothetical protein